MLVRSAIFVSAAALWGSAVGVSAFVPATTTTSASSTMSARLNLRTSDDNGDDSATRQPASVDDRRGFVTKVCRICQKETCDSIVSKKAAYQLGRCFELDFGLCGVFLNYITFSNTKQPFRPFLFHIKFDPIYMKHFDLIQPDWNCCCGCRIVNVIRCCCPETCRGCSIEDVETS